MALTTGERLDNLPEPHRIVRDVLRDWRPVEGRREGDDAIDGPPDLVPLRFGWASFPVAVPDCQQSPCPI